MLASLTQLVAPTLVSKMIDYVGVNVKDYKLDELRDLIGYVPQKNVLFSGDIASNLNFGNENGKEADWNEAAEIACVAEFVQKKDRTYHSAVSRVVLISPEVRGSDLLLHVQ